MKGGALLYKCRLCGDITPDMHVPDMRALMRELAATGDAEMVASKLGLPLFSERSAHVCERGRWGVSDFVGAQEDP